MYSNYQITNILENCFQNINCFSWIKLIHRFPYFVLPHSTTCHNYWMYQTIWQPKPIKLIIKLYLNHNTLLVKHTTYQKAESLRFTSHSKLDNAVNNNSIFNTKCTEFSTKWYVLFHFHNPTWSYNHPYNLYQNFSSANFHLPIQPLLIHKIILTIPTNTPFFYT